LEKIIRPSGTWQRPRATILCAGSAVMSSPRNSMRARLRAQQAGDGAQRGGLARAVAADERDDRARLDLNEMPPSAAMAP
jgi:hypothetical protein